MATQLSASEVSNINSLVKSGYVPSANNDPGRQEVIDKAIADSTAATSERLYTIQSRSAQTIYNGGTSRGDIASIRLITSNNLLGGIPLGDRAAAAGVGSADLYQLMGVTNNSSNKNNGYDRFLLTSCDVSYSEKTQIVTTFGDNEVIYYFGKNPVVMNLQGVLIDSLHNNWLVSFIRLYNSILRGTRLAQNFEMLELVLPNMKVVGSIMSLNHHQDSSRDTDIPFSLQFYAKSIEMLPQPELRGQATNISGRSIFKNPDKTTPGASLPNSIITSTGGFSEPSWLRNPLGVTTGYNIFRNNIISPVVSVIASLTKIVQAVNNNLTAIVSAFTNPLNAVLRDITSISVQATAVAVLIQNSAAGIGHLLATPGINLRNTLSSLKNTAGVISRLPENVADAFRRNYRGGTVNRSAAILSSGPKNNVSKRAVLSSGNPYTAQNSFNI